MTIVGRGVGRGSEDSAVVTYGYGGGDVSLILEYIAKAWPTLTGLEAYQLIANSSALPVKTGLSTYKKPQTAITHAWPTLVGASTTNAMTERRS